MYLEIGLLSLENVFFGSPCCMKLSATRLSLKCAIINWMGISIVAEKDMVKLIHRPIASLGVLEPL